MPDFRKHVAWYLKGFAVGGETARGVGAACRRWPSSTACSSGLDLDQPFPDDVLGQPARPHDTGPAGRAARRAGWPTAGRVACLRARSSATGG